LVNYRIALPSHFHRSFIETATPTSAYTCCQRRNGAVILVHSVVTDRSGIPLKYKNSGRNGTEDDSD
jgi:hypothetical protein